MPHPFELPLDVHQLVEHTHQGSNLQVYPVVVNDNKKLKREEYDEMEHAKTTTIIYTWMLWITSVVKIYMCMEEKLVVNSFASKHGVPILYTPHMFKKFNSI